MVTLLTAEEKISLRRISNKCILKLLEEYLNKYPEIRFGQALIILGICKDEGSLFNEESIRTFNKILSKFENQINK